MYLVMCGLLLADQLGAQDQHLLLADVQLLGGGVELIQQHLVGRGSPGPRPPWPGYPGGSASSPPGCASASCSPTLAPGAEEEEEEEQQGHEEDEKQKEH